MAGPAAAIDRTMERVARQSYGKLLAFIAARTRDLAGAEDALSDAFAEALAAWPNSGVPRNPEAWLLTVARRKSIDAARRRQTRQAGSDALMLLAAEAEMDREDIAEIPDERLRLMFACTHPAIDAAMHAPLMLQSVLGFDAGMIASAFLVAPAAMGQRLVRAKRKILEAGIPFRVPDTAELSERLPGVLDSIYACFAAGWSDPAGTLSRDPALTEEAIWLARVLTALLPREPEALGLLALMLHAEARHATRRDAAGEYVPLDQQNPDSWKLDLIEEAETLLLRASTMRQIGRFQLEAAIQSAHTARRRCGQTDWAAIVSLYDALVQASDSPVAALNRAVAIGRLSGARAGLAALDTVAKDPRMQAYQSYWAARAELLAANGDTGDALAAFERATGLEPDPAVRRFLFRRQTGLRPTSGIDPTEARMRPVDEGDT